MSRLTKVPFSPRGMQQLTLFINDGDATAQQQVKGGPWIGKVTHPSAVPDNHLLTVWNAKPLGDHDVDAGIYRIKDGKAIHEPGQMLRIKHDPKYDAQWPRALVPYQRIYGVREPRALKPLANDGRLSPHLPEGTPFGLVGSSSLYKRESFPDGKVAKGSVTATWSRDKQPVPYDMGWQNWRSQGADAGLYENADIHAVRILVMDPMLDDNRPTLTLTSPKAGANGPLTRILVGMHDYDSGLDMTTFKVTADFAIDGVKAERIWRRSSGRRRPAFGSCRLPGLWPSCPRAN